VGQGRHSSGGGIIHAWSPADVMARQILSSVHDVFPGIVVLCCSLGRGCQGHEQLGSIVCASEFLQVLLSLVACFY
jgi:hypothetical protein